MDSNECLYERCDMGVRIWKIGDSSTDPTPGGGSSQGEGGVRAIDR